MQHALQPFLEGCAISGGLIVAIGAQNAFVLRQGILKNFVLLTVITCILSDALMISMGVFGMGLIITRYPLFIEISKWAGIAFLIVYGSMALKRVFQSNATLDMLSARPSLKETIGILLAVTLLNPHAYLDTVVLIGGISNQYDEEGRSWFWAGSMAISITWFISLGFFSRYLAPLFQKPLTWKILDGLIAIMMYGIAVSLFFHSPAQCQI